MTWKSDEKSMNYMNYASLSFTLGHEMGHAFDPTGIQFDNEARNKNWMKNETFQAIKERYQCLVKQYNNMTDPKTKLNCKNMIKILRLNHVEFQF
jgi:predicted metalloendopeptidase